VQKQGDFGFTVRIVSLNKVRKKSSYNYTMLRFCSIVGEARHKTLELGHFSMVCFTTGDLLDVSKSLAFVRNLVIFFCQD